MEFIRAKQNNKQMKSFSQNGEDLIVAKYFETKYGANFNGNLLDIGANPTFSNATLLLNNGWSGTLVDASPKACKLLRDMWGCNKNVTLMPCAIGEKHGMISFFESGSHLPDGSDIALLSGVSIQDKWKGLSYEPIEVQMWTFKTADLHTQKWDFISIDAELTDWQILQQIDLTKVGCKCLVIEHNGDKPLAELFTSYCSKYALKEIHRNSENIIFCL